MKKIYISVCHNTIRRNIHLSPAQRKPPLRVSHGKYGKPSYYYDYLIYSKVRVVYDPENPLPCGARAWVEADDDGVS